MEITATFEARTRAQWRRWLTVHHASAREIWLVANLRESATGISYLDAVEEALCFGWVDGLAKKFDADRRAQRFTPRRPKSHWTELNRARARRLIAEGRMAPAGAAVLPDLTWSSFVVPEGIARALAAVPGARATFDSFPELYRRVRIAYVEEQLRVPEEHARRLANLVKQTAAGKMFGNWDDRGMRRSHAIEIGE